MGKSRNGRRSVERLTAVCFDPRLFFPKERGNICCGASTLALLTGIPPERIAKEHNRWKRDYPDWLMLKFLRQHGFSVYNITTDWVVNGGRISMRHVVLISQLLRKGEGTWGVMYNGMYYHNFDIYAVGCLSLLNQPKLSAYIVAHPRYRRFGKYVAKIQATAEGIRRGLKNHEEQSLKGARTISSRSKTQKNNNQELCLT